MKRLFCLKATNGLGRFAPSALPHYYIYVSHTGGTIIIEHDVYEHSCCYSSFIFVCTWFTSAVPVNALQSVTDGYSGSRGSSGSDSVSSMSESRAQARVRCSRAEDSGWGLWLERVCTYPGKIPGTRYQLLLLYAALPVRKKATYEVMYVATQYVDSTIRTARPSLRPRPMLPLCPQCQLCLL